MNWNKGLSARYYCSIVNPITWHDTGETFNITGGSISHSLSDLMESADVDCVRYPQNTERWIRVYLDARQSGAAEHIAMFTGLATSPDRNIDGLYETNKVQCYSVLKPAQDVLLPRGWYAPVGIDGAKLIKRLLGVTPAPVDYDPTVEAAPTLKRAIIAEDGESNLSMAHKILTAIGWRFRITGDGVIHICPTATEHTELFDSFENDSIEPVLTVTADWYGCPNVFRATQGDASAEARDESESLLSIPNRGREVWMEETNVNLSERETLLEYAKRRLKEEQQVAYIVKYDRRYRPDLYVSDIVELHCPAQGIDGEFVITSQSIELGYAARTSEEVQNVAKV